MLLLSIFFDIDLFFLMESIESLPLAFSCAKISGCDFVKFKAVFEYKIIFKYNFLIQKSLVCYIH